MIVFPGAPTWLGLGWIIALVVLIIDIVLLILGQVPMVEGLLIGGVALARIL